MYGLWRLYQILWCIPGTECIMDRVKAYLKEHKMAVKIISTIIGAGLGFAYYKFVGCRTGACPITSNPWISTVWGGLIGFLIAG